MLRPFQVTSLLNAAPGRRGRPAVWRCLRRDRAGRRWVRQALAQRAAQKSSAVGAIGDAAARPNLSALLVHGDEADRRRGYRLTRRLVRGRPFAALIDALGPIRGQRALDALAGAPGAHRIAFHFEFPPQAKLDPALAQIVLAAAMLGAEALPRGGALRITPLGGAGLVVLPEGRVAAWPHALIERLAGMAPAGADTPRALLAPWLIALAEAAQCRLSLGMGQPGLPPLLLQPPR